ncbi:tol-pal system-associated acyl-CoA thioesterase [Citreimonas sp.]|uniref:tol-pal system-associated acyl-CoA thioesterase n=1 Tax=Citreimonas sp. TaxID=3036715 RepID=UPI00405A199E
MTDTAPPGPAPVHGFDVRVYYEDTDMAGIVYHANYLKYIERARSDWVREQGLDQNAMRAAGVVFVVRRIECDYLAPARYDDALVVRTQVESMSRVRLVMVQQVVRGDAVLFRARVTAACATLAGRPTRLPEALTP